MIKDKLKYLFLDDVRLPYLDPITYKNKLGEDQFHFISTYHYSKVELFKTKTWSIVRNYDEFVEWVKIHGVDDLFISFDHDLCDTHYRDLNDNKDIDENYYDNQTIKTGYHCAEWLCKYCIENNKNIPDYYVHSWNVIGTTNINNIFKKYKNNI